MNRRKFIAASAGITALWKTSALAARDEEAVSTLPDSISGLTSMRAQARPITNEERASRMERARTLMARAKMDALVLTPGTSLTYFTNIRWFGGERLFACVIPRKGEPFFVCPYFEEDRAREQIALGPFAGKADVRTWQEEESPFALVAGGLKDRGAGSGAIGIDESAKFVFSDSIASAAPHARVVSGTPVTAGCRMIKDAHELELMQLANTATLKVYEAVYRAMEPGMTQTRFGELIDLAYQRVGFRGDASVQTGEFTALPHGSMAPQIIREGTIIMVDDGCTVEDTSRTSPARSCSAKPATR